MVDLLSQFTSEQMTRYECYRRSSLPKSILKRLFQTVTSTAPPPNGLIILAAVGKLFVGELVEKARQMADEDGLMRYEWVIYKKHAGVCILEL